MIAFCRISLLVGDGFDILEHLRIQNKEHGEIIISARDILEDKKEV